MSPDPKFQPVADGFAGVDGVTGGELMASYGPRINGKIFAMYGRNQFVVKLPKERVDELTTAGRCKRFDPGHGRIMKEWAAFETGEASWIDLAREAFSS